MALIHRLFNPRERKGRSWGKFRNCSRNDKHFETPETLASHTKWQAPEFEESQIRLLVFRERDKQLLFDSKAIRKKKDADKQPPRSNPCAFSGPFSRLKPSATSSSGSQESLPCSEPNNGSPSSNNSNYTFLRPSSDVKLLAEMMFGSDAMVYRGPLLKVHNIKVPPQLLLSQVFVLKRPKDASIDQDSLDKDSISLASTSDLGMPRSISMSSIGDMDKEPVAHSMPVAVPQSPYKNRDDNSPAASASSNSFLTPFPSPLSTGNNTPNSYHKRWLRNQVTSMENGVMRRRSSDVVEEPISRRVRTPKISVGILISLFEEGETEKMQMFQSFFFSHFNLIESLFYKLSCAIEKALTFNRRNYVRPVMQAMEEFRSSVHSLYTAPRIQKPIWLNMMTFPGQRNHLCEHLMRELMQALEMYNNRQTNFFLSRLLTGVLTHHLAWVPTVMPAGATPSRAYLDKHSSTTLDWLAKSHPYNPLWAQLGDMYGVVGYPSKVAKTVIVGKKADLVCRLLYILTYFIRCSEVHESQERREEVVMEYKELQHMAMATESGYYSDFSKEALDGDDHQDMTKAQLHSDQTHHLESSLETVEETSESLASPVESGSALTMERKLTLTNCKTETTYSPEDGERTPVGYYPGEIMIKCKDDVPVVDGQREFSAPVGKAPPTDSQLLCSKVDPGIQERKQEFMFPERNSCISDSKQMVIKCKDDVFLKRTREVEVPVGHVDISDGQSKISVEAGVRNFPMNSKLPLYPVLQEQKLPNCESIDFSGHGDLKQEIRCKENTLLEAKQEHVVNVGRSANLDNRVSCVADRTDTNENQIINGYSGGDSLSLHIACDSRVKTDNGYHISNCNTVKPCDLPGLKLATTQCNTTQPVDSKETGGRRSPDVKETHDLYRHSNTKLEVNLPQENVKPSLLHSLSSNSETEKPSFLRSLSSNSSTSSVFSNDADYQSGLWMGQAVNKGSEVIADSHPASTNDRYDRYNRCISTTSVRSTSSSRSYETDGTLTPDHEELPLAFSELDDELKDDNKSTYIDNFGRSLLGGLSQKYIPQMALHGVSELDEQSIVSELELSVQHSVLDEPITETVCIVADTDKWTVELLSSERPLPTAEKPLAQEIACADSVSELLDSVQQLWNMRMPSDFCLMHLEDGLEQVYFKSTLMAAYLDKNPTSCHKDLSVSLGVETSDIPLLLGVTSVHAPQVIMNVLRETFDKQVVDVPCDDSL